MSAVKTFHFRGEHRLCKNVSHTLGGGGGGGAYFEISDENKKCDPKKLNKNF